jgi:hypothetical protein
MVMTGGRDEEKEAQSQEESCMDHFDPAVDQE